MKARLTAKSGGLFCYDMLTIADIVDAVAAPYTVWRSLHGLEPEMREGCPRFVAGNAAVSFVVRYDERRYMLKCYTRRSDRLSAIYGDAFRPKELCVIDFAGRYHWVDCLLMEYIEGRSLDEALAAATTAEEYAALAEAFDSMALDILRSERAHGDLKPENIIVGEDGVMTAIDWDAAYVPAFAGCQALETGTAAYQHPLRDMSFYDKHIDDYSIAFISTLLHLAAVSPEALAGYATHREPPIHPRELVSRSGWTSTDVHRQIVEEFARRGMAREYQVAMLLRSPFVRLADLAEIFSATVTIGENVEEPTLEFDGKGRWGVQSKGEWILPPLYTSAVGISEGVALLGLGAYRHFVRLSDGVVLASFGEESNVGPLRDGCTTLSAADGQSRIIRVVVDKFD